MNEVKQFQKLSKLKTYSTNEKQNQAQVAKIMFKNKTTN